MDPTLALTTAIENSTKVANTPLFSTVLDRILGYKISEWNAQGSVIKKQIQDGYEEAKRKGMGIQYAAAFRSSTNLINMSAKATKYIDTSRQNEIELDNDVFWGLVEYSKEVSNEDMQELIAKIIAGEYNSPETYSMHTLQVLKMLGKKELELFEKMCSLLVNIEQIPKKLLYLDELVKEFMNELGIDFGKLQILQSLGLFLPNEMESASIKNPEKKKFQISYFDKVILFEPENDNYLEVKMPSYFGLSPVGKQILNHLNPVYNDQYYEWLRENYKINNYKVI